MKKHIRSLNKVVNPAHLLGMMIIVFMLVACSDGGVPAIPVQYWQGLEVRLETRPQVITPGMTEFLVIVTDGRGLPGHELVVSLRMDSADAWSQAIQDGHSGVFRRAIRVKPGQAAVWLQLQGRDVATKLHFPLNISQVTTN